MIWNPFSRTHTSSERGATTAPTPPAAGAPATPPAAGAPPKPPAATTEVSPSASPAPAARAPEELREEAIRVLRDIYDPEIPVNIYELGLVYDVTVAPPGDIEVRMTLTAPSCPAAGALPGEVESRLLAIPGVRAARVELVWDPPWSPDLMSESARLQLNL